MATNILFICTHNRCRSILCEAITNHLSNGRVQAFSAGSAPAAEVHPLTLQHLRMHEIPTHNLISQCWESYKHQPLDIVITVCDSAASEPCPIWFGDCAKVHWGLPDPSRTTGSEQEINSVFEQVIATIEQRTHKLLQLDFENLSRSQRQQLLNQLVKDI